MASMESCSYIKGKDIDKVVLEKEPPEEKRCKQCAKALTMMHSFGEAEWDGQATPGEGE